MNAISRDEQDDQRFHINWAAVSAGGRFWKRTERVAPDPFLVGKAVKLVMKGCPHRTATGKPLVWNDYAVFLELAEWERLKELESTLVRDLSTVVQKAVKDMRAEMVGSFHVRLLRDEGGSVRAGTAVIKADYREGERTRPDDPGEVTIRVKGPLGRQVADVTTRIPDGFTSPAPGEEHLRVSWAGGTATIRAGARVVLGRPHSTSSPGFVALAGAGSKINKRQVWIEAGAGGAIIGRLSEANPVEVMGRLVQPGGQIAIDDFPAEVSLSSGEMTLIVERVPAA